MRMWSSVSAQPASRAQTTTTRPRTPLARITSPRSDTGIGVKSIEKVTRCCRVHLASEEVAGCADGLEVGAVEGLRMRATFNPPDEAPSIVDHLESGMTIEQQ